jgi:hypothetical protein
MDNPNIDPTLTVDQQPEDTALFTALELKLDEVFSNTKFAEVLKSNNLQSSLHLRFSVLTSDENIAMPKEMAAILTGCYVQQSNGTFKWKNPCPT